MKGILTLVVVILGWTQGYASTVPVGERLYDEMDKLIGAGMVRTALKGDRPWGREEFARLLIEGTNEKARTEGNFSELSREEQIYLTGVLDRLKSEFRREIELALGKDLPGVELIPLEEASVDYFFDDSRNFVLTPESGLGSIDARINPLTLSTIGESSGKGHGLKALSHHRLRIGLASFDLSPEVFLFRPEQASSAYFRRAQARIAWPNLSIQVGRDEVVWGGGRYGGLLHGLTQRGQDMVKASFTLLPGGETVFHHIAPIRFTLLLADLGGQNYHPRARFFGGRIGFRLFPGFELGFGMTVIGGGEGGPPFQWYYPVLALFTNRHEGQELGDRRGGGDLRLVLPFLRGAEWTLEYLIEDVGPDSFTEKAAYKSGLFFPRLGVSGESDLRVEFERIGAWVYRHGEWRSGYTLDQCIIASELGPDSWSLKVSHGILLTPFQHLGFLLRYGEISGNVYLRTGDDDYQVLDAGKLEKRLLFLGSAELEYSWNLAFRFSSGIEFSSGSRIPDGEKRVSFLVSLGLTIDLDH